MAKVSPKLACECGCGDFTPAYPNQRFATAQCGQTVRAWRRYGKWIRPSEPIPCAFGCGTRFTPKMRQHQYCSPECCDLSLHLTRGRGMPRPGAQPRVYKGYALIRELVAEVEPGRCLYCEEKLTGIRRILCGDRECRRLYDRDWRAGVRLDERNSRPPPEERTCLEESCKKPFTPRCKRQVYCCREHQLLRLRKLSRAARLGAVLARAA